ncbi:At-Rich Interactive Domain-Containing Protein 1B [Manis pentadactyla]|nr:At-Rich Interactive Domain-Containing Protein 1B [Manis pentadactyla]
MIKHLLWWKDYGYVSPICVKLEDKNGGLPRVGKLLKWRNQDLNVAVGLELMLVATLPQQEKNTHWIGKSTGSDDTDPTGERYHWIKGMQDLTAYKKNEM